MSSFFITGTGTGVGKTFVTCALVRQLRARGREVHALKPVLSGLDEGGPSDAERLLHSLGVEPSAEAVARVSPFRFKAPLSPDMAARREGRILTVDEIVRACREAERGADGGTLLVEGVGGAFVPLNEREVVADWIRAFGSPALVVAGSYLGTLSHTLSTVAAMWQRRVEVAAVIVSESLASPAPLEETVATLRRFVEVPIVALPRASLDEARDLTSLIV